MCTYILRMQSDVIYLSGRNLIVRYKYSETMPET